MAYISDLLGKPVADVEGERLGRLGDLIATLRPELRHPEIVAIKVERKSDALLVPLAAVAVLLGPACALSRRKEEIVPYQTTGTELWLVRDVLDRQIIDTTGVRVVRVNDVEILRAGNRYYVANVDIGGLGLLRRLGLARPVQSMSRHLGKPVHPSTISWDAVELLPGGGEMRLRVPGDKITDLHPADLAEIISDLTRAESSMLLEALDVKVVADTLENVEPDFQASLVETMADEKVADVLEEMAPDEAADLLAELPKTRSQELLRLMEREEAEDVRRLLEFPEDTAGGLMTTEYAAVSPDLSAEEALAVLRETADEAETIFYVYVVDAQGRLLGWFSLSDLVLARPKTKVADLVRSYTPSVLLQDSQNAVAQTVIKYNLLAVPVVNDEGRLQGIVTSDDALDRIIPTAWKKRLPSLYR
ncbi:MAG: CBS domain-containing protein [Anaerolineales bacterium]|nr:CBS domain-containing protein [Anaerolineales bacterium]